MNNNKTVISAVIVAIGLMVGAFTLSTSGPSGAPADGNVGGGNVAGTNGSNVSIVDGKQIVEIDVKGGYRPTRSVAKAGIPTIIKFKTNGTFDCSSSIRISSLNINQILPQTGATDIDVGSPGVGVLAGTCGMGMYRFEVDFRS